MRLARICTWGVCAGALILLTGVASGQEYPNKPIRLIAPGVGGIADVTARILAPEVSAILGKPVIVENRPSGIIPGQIVSQSHPDGYTLLLYGPPVWIMPLMQDKMSYDPVKDLAPVTMAINTPSLLVVNSSLPVSSVAELLALAKAKPGQLNYATNGGGSSGHLAGELLKAMAGLDIVRINYAGGGAAIADLLAGRVQYYFAPRPTVVAQINAGKLKALAVAGAKPSPLAPGLPTVSATLPGYSVESSTAVFTRAGTPQAIINRLNQAFVSVLTSAAVKETTRNGVSS